MNKQEILLKIVEKEFSLLVFCNGKLIFSRKGQNPMAICICQLCFVLRLGIICKHRIIVHFRDVIVTSFSVQ